VVGLRSLYYPWASEKLKFDLCGCLREERVERNPVLCGLLNRDVESLSGFEPRVKNLVSLVFDYFTSSLAHLLYLLFVPPCSILARSTCIPILC
jgi:hypothetical protein